jgi:predicted small secreted protein
MNIYLKIAAVLMFLFGAAACNTTRGLGEDVEATGEQVQETAQDVEDEIKDND